MGKISKNEPSACRASASCGRTQHGSNCSNSSATGSWPSGIRATRKGTSKRRGKSRSVTQWASKNTSAPASSSPLAWHCAANGALRSSSAISAVVGWLPSAYRASSTPSSSKLSRMAAMACVRCRSLWLARLLDCAWLWASAASMPPPGKTYAPGAKLAVRARRVISTSTPWAVSRSSKIVAAKRRGAGGRWG